MAVLSTDLYIIERGGVNYSVTAADISAFVQSQVGTSEYQVADITARNALTGLTLGDTVMVDDASDDATVDAGWALYRWMGVAFTKIAEEESLDIVVASTDLSYIASPTQGIIESSTGNNATIPAADATNAGLQTPAQFTTVSNITATAPVNLDTLAAASHAAVTLAGSVNNNPHTLTGQVLGFSISQLTAAP